MRHSYKHIEIVGPIMAMQKNNPKMAEFRFLIVYYKSDK